MRRLVLLFAFLLAPRVSAETASPSEFLKLSIGKDRTLADYRQILSYFRYLDEASPRMELEVLGKSTLGEDMVMAVISSEANLKKKDRLRAIARRLADPRGLGDAEAAKLVGEGRTILLVTCSIHASEIGASQMAMEWAHALVTARDAETKRRLDNVVLLLVPSLNPDGQIMETEWYRQHVGTKHEGVRMPWLYHHYVGHDNNRDWLALSQKETRAMTRAIYHQWYPQLFVDEHQMGMMGPRMFIPPVADPIDPDIPPLLWREMNLVGTHIAYRLEQHGKAGVISGFSYDGYWVGGNRTTPWWKNIDSLLFETASVRLATPVYIEPTELTGGKGLTDHQPQANYPNPWRGGWWRLRDIVDYERIASDALHEIAANHREDMLRGLLDRARAAVTSAKPGEAYRIPAQQRDYPSARRLARLLADHGVDVLIDGRGDAWVPLAQPYSRFVREVLEPQRYPEVRPARGSDILRPYDVVSWSLPIALGVTVEHTTMPSVSGMKRVAAPILGAPPPAATKPRGGAAYAVSPASPESARVVNAALRAGRVSRVTTASNLPIGTFILDQKAAEAAAAVGADAGVVLQPVSASGTPLKTPRVGLYKSYAASMDEGWTRFLLEQYGFAPVSLDNAAIKKGKLRDALDVIVLPSMSKDAIGKGNGKADGYEIELPEKYRGGLEKEGSKALRAFVEAGGTLIALGASCEYTMEELRLPVRNLLGKDKAGVDVPGAMLRGLLSREHPVTWGLPREVAMFQDMAMAFGTEPPGNDMERTVLVTYPGDHRDVLRSGWMAGADRLAGRAAVVAVTVGQGKVALFGFRPQNRAQTNGTFLFLFNAIYWSVQ